VEELIKQLEEKTGLDVDQIKDVIEGVAGFLGDKLPGPLADQIKGLLGAGDGGDSGDNDGGGGGLMDQAKDMLGGFLGGD
jgi:hypothetical protein